MKSQKTLLAAALLASAAASSTAQASLVDRGNGLLYDNVLNVTWLQDANYAKTSGASATGQMDRTTAGNWAANLVYGGYSDWRLATNTPIAGGITFNAAQSFNGTTDFGYNITSPKSELAYMYYVNLGLKALMSPTQTVQSDYGIFGNGTYNGVDTNSGFGQANVGLVHNLQNYNYWTGALPGVGMNWQFIMYSGAQTPFLNPNPGALNQYYAWAVRPGDVSPVPVPGAVWLFGSGLLGLLGFKRRGNIG